jgi:hypothetical protein
MPKSLEEGNIKFTILTEAPDDVDHPTITELNAGIDAACTILDSDFTWGATDSDTNPEKPLCQANNSVSLGSSNFQGGITIFREFDSTDLGKPDSVTDIVFAAVKTKGTELWCYARRTGKAATLPWVALDEIYLGGHVITDVPQPIKGGFIKERVTLLFQEAYDHIAAAAAGS